MATPVEYDLDYPPPPTVEAILASVFDALDGAYKWRQRAACRSENAAKFFRAYAYRRNAATAVCGVCTVRAECLAYALSIPADDDRYGVFGGTTPSERKQLRRRLRVSIA